MEVSLAWSAHPETWLLVAFLVISYMGAITYVGPNKVAPGEPVATTRQKSFFLLGVLALWLAEDWPIHEIAEQYLFSGHMLQHILFAFVAPPLILMGLPSWMFRSLIGRDLRFYIFRFLSKPAIAFLLFNGIIALMHYAPIVNLQSENSAFHATFHLSMISAGILMWVNIVSPAPEFNRMTEPVKMMYLFLMSIIPTVPSSFLTFSERPLYRVYDEAPRLWNIDVLTDQRISGLLMKLGAGLLLWAVIAVMFFRWNAREENMTDKPVGWTDFERELEVWDLRK